MDHCSENHKPMVVAVASYGGHLVQLERILKRLEDETDVLWVTTRACSELSENIVIDDFSRSDPWMFFPVLFRMMKILKEVRPSCVVTTGAAPGLAAVFAAKMLGVRSLWIDSLANSESLSLSGRVAVRIADKVLTQWPHLENEKVKYYGSVI